MSPIMTPTVSPSAPSTARIAELRSLGQAASNTYFNYEYGIEDYIDEAKYYRNKGPSAEWFETEVSRDTRQPGDIAHLFSIYAFGGTGSERIQPIRGTNSFHLVKEDVLAFPTSSFVEYKWHITSWHWSAEIPDIRYPR